MLRNNKGFYVAQGLSEELFLMRAFVSQQENQINNYIKNIEDYVETTEVGKWYENPYGDGEKVLEEVKHIEGIAEDDYDFKGIFTEIMPLYQRQAMLVALWGRIECKLDDIVKHLSMVKNVKVKIKPRGLSDFRHLVNEIERLGIKITDNKECHIAVDFLNKEVREIRNAWVNNGGILARDKIKNIVKSSNHLKISLEKIDVTNEYILFSIDEMVKISRKILNEFIAQRIS